MATTGKLQQENILHKVKKYNNWKNQGEMILHQNNWQRI